MKATSISTMYAHVALVRTAFEKLNQQIAVTRGITDVASGSLRFLAEHYCDDAMTAETRQAIIQTLKYAGLNKDSIGMLDPDNHLVFLIDFATAFEKMALALESGTDQLNFDFGDKEPTCQQSSS